MDKTEEGLQTFMSVGSTIGIEKEDLGGWVHADTYSLILNIYEQLESRMPILNKFISTFRTNIPLKKISVTYKENQFFVKIKHKEVGIFFDFKEIINDAKYWGLIEQAIKKIVTDKLLELVFVHKDEIIKKAQSNQQQSNWTRIPNMEIDSQKRQLKESKDKVLAKLHSNYTPALSEIKNVSVINDSPYYIKLRRLITRIMDDKRNNRLTCASKVENKKDIQITISRKEFFNKLDCNNKEEERRILQYFFENTHALDIATAKNNYYVETFYKRRIITENDERLNNLTDVQSLKKIVSISFCVDYNIYNSILPLEETGKNFGYAQIIDNPDKILESLLSNRNNIELINSYSDKIKIELGLNNKKATVRGYKNSMVVLLEYIYYQTTRIAKSQVKDIELSLVEIANRAFKSYVRNGVVKDKGLLKYFILVNLYIIQLAHSQKALDYFEEFIAYTHTKDTITIKLKTHPKSKKIELQTALF